MGKIWSICIPTYNRASNLRINLEYIYRQLNSDNRDLIEIIVSNNASTDNTDEVVRDYISKGMELSYYKNTENLGADGNFLQCVDKAAGKYVLLLGDDDYLALGAVDRVLEVLLSDDYGAVYISRNMLPPSKGFLRCKVSNSNNRVLIFDEPNEYLKNVSFWLTFMSGNIFRKDILGEIGDYMKYNHTHLLQTAFYITAALQGKKCAVFSDHLLTTAGNENGGYSFIRVFCNNFNELMQLFVTKGLSTTTIAEINNDMIVNYFVIWLGIIRFHKTRFKNEDADVILRSVYAENWRYWICLWPIISWPKPLGWIWWIGMRGLRKFKLL